MVFEQGAHKEGDEPDGHDGGDDVREEEGEVFGEREQQDIEEHEGDAHEGILNGVDGGEAAVLDKEDYGEGEQDDEVGILDAAGGLLVLLDGNFEVDTKRLGVAQFAVGVEHLGKVAVQRQHFPVGIETLCSDFSVGGQIAAGETGCGTVGGEADRGGASHGEEIEVVGTFERHSKTVGDLSSIKDRLDVYTA